MTSSPFLRSVNALKKFITERSYWLSHKDVNLIKETLTCNEESSSKEVKIAISFIEDILDFLDKRSYKKVSYNLIKQDSIKSYIRQKDIGPDYLRDRCILVLAFFIQINNNIIKGYIKNESELQEVISKDSQYILCLAGWLDHFGGWGVLKRSIITEFYSSSELSWLKSEIIRCPYIALDYSNIDPQIWLDYLTNSNKKVLYLWNHGLVLVKSHINYTSMDKERAELITQLLKLNDLPLSAWKNIKNIPEEINTGDSNINLYSDYGRYSCNGSNKFAKV